MRTSVFVFDFIFILNQEIQRVDLALWFLFNSELFSAPRCVTRQEISGECGQAILEQDKRLYHNFCDLLSSFVVEVVVAARAPQRSQAQVCVVVAVNRQ
jgi:hypothetical protein